MEALMNYKKNLTLTLMLLLGYFMFAEDCTQHKLLEEYNALYNRIKYAKQPGFCYDGLNKIKEEKVAGSEHSFYVTEENVYLQVVETDTKKIFYTRCFDITELGGQLAINSKFKLLPKIKIDGHWHFAKIGKTLNVIICSDENCINTEIPLYEINDTPIDIIDGIFLSFKDGVSKKASNAKISTKTKPMPVIDLQAEKTNIANLIKKMKGKISQKDIAEKQKILENLFANYKGHL